MDNKTNKSYPRAASKIKPNRPQRVRVPAGYVGGQGLDLVMMVLCLFARVVPDIISR